MTKLLPCPFCGSSPIMLYHRRPEPDNVMQHGSIICNSCHIHVYNWHDIRTETRYETSREEKAIEKWNTRTKA